MDEEDRKEKIDEIIDSIDRDIERPPYDKESDNERSYSRSYKEYREAEQEHQEKTRYEKLCITSSSILNLSAGENTREKLAPSLRLLGWDVTPGMVLSATVAVFLASMVSWFLVFAVNQLLGPLLPTSLTLLMLTVPIAAAAYTYYLPKYAAKNKVVKSSGEMILAILYMVVYMRSSPNLEGAIRFAALNLDGPISDDLKGVLWKVEVGKYNTVSEALEKYTRRWKDFNNDFLESLDLIRAAMREPSPDRRESVLQDAIDNILDGTKEKMKHYAQNLKTPVMILNALGAMLPVLGMIMLPLISVFLGGVVTPLHLFVIFNLLLPGFLYWFMQRTLSARPPTISTQVTEKGSMPERGKYTVAGMRIPSWPIGLGVFIAVSAYGFLGYLTFPQMYPVTGFEATGSVPGVFLSGGNPAPVPMLMRSVSIVFGLGLGIGLSKTLGSLERKKAEKKLQKIEQQFPNALFELGNKISGGTPVELALEEAAESTSDLEISELFYKASSNVKNMGMTFEDAIFNDSYGALNQFPSKMIETVMKAIVESSEKGTGMASTAMMTISRYLKNIHKTQEQLNDLMESTTTTIQMLAYLLAPIVSGVAVGMSQTIISAMYKLSQSFQQTQTSLPAGAPASTPGFGGILGNLNDAIPPEMLQLVVGVYLIQLLFILGTFYVKITEGESKTSRDLFTGKIMISGMFFYAVTLLIITLLFGGLVNSVASV
ncbi:MAG: hypothetical protein ABEJ98_05940 [Candidatus Nanohaloarchaea archaeon]